ncbi:uncharacterized protein MONOS_11182 [Monocercomonoides exilis]|uniref:uncharacterized protein n=1 Tax=Monocercomonoides exilis TaxID=2049356 RepID=UPI003559B121|nr:hypothetical protein MONOS_11182 [Monocercomonoides exilis]|eukprot:MONOS_11182.1-p1 / transcript=MONOS_11182.1 / gene=MONOS_11182 / organism=Monocercomonoides_exilis_PA203 / gene_product=unspecified product / transcript_product=unspecified product / location=Mono_scaffold00547:15867-24947(-) / protein_length=3009 / sequence_SO=supercontig / SO=protein_coding / is_pseudo=false
MHLFLLAHLILVKTFEARDVSETATFQNKGCSNDAQYLSENDNNYLFEQSALLEVKRLQSGLSIVKNTFLEFFNSTVGLKNLAIEHSSSQFLLITEKSRIILDSCILHQNFVSPFHLQSGSVCFTNLSLIIQKNHCPSSLIFSSDDSNSAILRKSMLSDLIVSSSDYFLLSGKSKSEEISNCAFRNISVKPFKNIDDRMEHSCFRSLMENSLIFSCVNVFEGGISSGSYSSHEFVCRNTSTNNGKRERNVFQPGEQMDTTESQSFLLCEWKDCTAEQGGALYVHDNENAILTIENSSFVKCIAFSTIGGGIFALEVAECSVLHSKFVQCSCTSTNVDNGGGGISIANICIQPIVDDCSFFNCSSGNDGGAIDLRESLTEKQKNCITNSFFDNCKSNGSLNGIGGAIEHWYCSDQAIISNCLFCNCNSMCGGGALGILINNNNYGTFLYHCFFHNNSCVKGGHDILLQNSTANNIHSSCCTTRQTGNRVSTNYNSIIDKSEWLRNEGGRVRYVSSTETEPNSIDTYACGLNESYPCRTISHCLTQLIPDFVKDIEILTGTITETKNIDCDANSFTIYGKDDLSTTVQTELETPGLSLFSTSTGTFTVRNLVLVHDPTYSNNRGSRLFEITGAGEIHISRLNISTGSTQSTETAFFTELINVQSGVLQMENLNWAKTISTTSLFSLSSTNEISLILSESTFNEIERTTSGASVVTFSDEKANIDLNSSIFDGCGSTTSANGGSAMLNVGEANEVKVKGGNFDGCFCSTTDGLGGAILLQLTSEFPEFLITSSFDTNTAKWGKDIFVISPHLETVAQFRKISSVNASLDSFDKVRGYDNGNTNLAIPLCIYLLPNPTEIYVSNSEASNHSHCGIVQFPCLTLKHSLSRLSGTKKVVVNGMIQISDELSFAEQKHEIRGNDEQSGWTVSDSSSSLNSAMITTSVETTLSILIFSLPSSLPLHSTFISSSSSLKLSQCSLSLQDPSLELELTFLSEESGILTIDTFLASSVVFGGSPLISVSGGNTEAKLKRARLNEIETRCSSGLFEVKSKASLQMGDCVVSSIAPPERIASSRLISSTSAKKIEIIRTDISNFAVKDKNGGAFECTLESGCSFVFEEGSMSLCKSDGGSGGGLWVQMKSGSSLSIGNVTESLSNNENGNEEEKKVCFSHCEASSNVDGRIGLGGGIYMCLDDGASDFVLKRVQFEGCSGRKGKDVFMEADDLSVVTNSETFCFDIDVNDFQKLNGFERSTTNEEFEIPLVVYLWNNFTTPCHVGGQETHDFSGCGHVQIPCKTITKAVGFRFSNKKKSIKLVSPFSFGEELKMETDEWSVIGDGNATNYGVAEGIAGAQRGLFETHIQTAFSEVVFSLEERIGTYECVFHCVSNKLTIQDCGIVGCENELSVSFVKVEGGEAVMNNLFGNAIRWQTSAIIAEGRSGGFSSVEIVESNFSGSGEQNGCLVESRNAKCLNLTKCKATSFVRSTGNGGSISVDNSNNENENTQINIEECDFDECSVLADGSRGGAVFVQMKKNTQVNINSCSFTGCVAPAGENKNGFGGGMALELNDGDPSFAISCPIFDSSKPNVARYGKDLFVESSDLTKSITNASLPFVSENMNDISLDSLRGFDGNDKENAIPLVYFWRGFDSTIFVGREGIDVCICGLSDYPCLSIDHSLDRLSKGNERMISVIEKAVLQKSVDLNGISIKSEDTGECSLECLSSIEGAEEAVMKIRGITKFELINFVVPSSFSNEANVLMYIGSSEGLLTLKDCSFAKNEDDGEDTINFGLIKVDEGKIVLDLVSVQFLCFSQDVVSVLSSACATIKNLTMKNVELKGASGLSISKSSSRESREKNEAEQNVVIEWSIFEEVTQNTTDDISIIRNVNDEPLKMVVQNTTMKRCGGLKCGKGGGTFCVLNEGGSFDCSFCTISECFCSTVGRGGWLFLECTSTAEQPLNFVLSNITFKDNSALKGRDVYVRCHSIDTQIADEQFLLDFRAPFVKELAIWGCTTDSFEGEEDLLLRVKIFRSETVFVSAVIDNHEDSRECGVFEAPCRSLSEGMHHIIPSLFSQLLILRQTEIVGKCAAHDVIIRSLEAPSTALVFLNSTIVDDNDDGSLIAASENVRIERLKFNFCQSFSYSGNSIIHEANGQLSLSFVDFSFVGESENIEAIVLNSTLLSIERGILHVDNCTITMLSFKKPSFLLGGNEININNVRLEKVEAISNVFDTGNCGRIVLNGIDADGVKLSEGCIISINSSTSGTLSVGSSSFNNCSRKSEGPSIFSAFATSTKIILSNCSCSNCYSQSDKGSFMDVNNATNVLMNLCEFEGTFLKGSEDDNMNSIKDICLWNGSLVHSENASLMMKDVSISNSSSGGLSVSSSNVTIEKGEFLHNNPFIDKYPSLRRNIICSDSGALNVMSLKGGDGVKDNSSLWILNEGCNFEGIISERSSPFFVPVLDGVEAKEVGEEMEIVFKGKELLPCDLSFMVVRQMGEEKQIEKYEFDESGYVSETEVEGRLPKEMITEAEEGVEVSVCIQFGDGNNPSSTDSFILKNKSESKTNGEGKLAEGGKEGKSYLLLIVIIMGFVLLIILIVAVIFIVRWRKAKNENKDLREIVNDNIRKDPKAFEMVTMEMSPEEQWRRAEREAEKKNEERMKKRVYEKSLGHSESSEHLLSESGLTEYILGRDSDKIPDWALEKVEEEEIRKRSPSPSISSTSTTDTTDSDSTFVRGEDLCPTTSSMSNLVDAMACSSPHEKLIVDLRDSLFMLLHGRNEKKEMAIGSLKEREQTTAQVLFWVANGALHSFDEMENPLQSLANLSPHIVLFSEHMVICIVMHSDLLSDDDSDSSSISSSTVVTSASDDDGDDDDDSLPSSAFEEDEDAFRKECLRWKAPELQMNKKMGATKESVVFSIGMMVWECLTLEIPFGEYEGVVAGQKIVNGERPNVEKMGGSSLRELEEKCVVQGWDERVTLGNVKRELFMKMPMGSMFVTASDALDIGDGSRCEEADSEDTDGSFSRME